MNTEIPADFPAHYQALEDNSDTLIEDGDILTFDGSQCWATVIIGKPVSWWTRCPGEHVYRKMPVPKQTGDEAYTALDLEQGSMAEAVKELTNQAIAVLHDTQTARECLPHPVPNEIKRETYPLLARTLGAGNRHIETGINLPLSRQSIDLEQGDVEANAIDEANRKSESNGPINDGLMQAALYGIQAPSADGPIGATGPLPYKSQCTPAITFESMQEAADEIRKDCNQLTSEQRADAFNHAMQIIQSYHDGLLHGLKPVDEANWKKQATKPDFMVPSSAAKKPYVDPCMKTFSTGAKREDKAGKGRFDLIPYEPMRQLAVHFEEGGKRHGDNNWQKGIPLSVYLSAAKRHSAKAGCMIDENHAIAACWNFFCLLQTVEWIKQGRLSKELDDINWIQP